MHSLGIGYEYDIPMKIMFENLQSVHLTVYRGTIRQLVTVWTPGI